jgi:hypothetical protein
MSLKREKKENFHLTSSFIIVEEDNYLLEDIDLERLNLNENIFSLIFFLDSFDIYLRPIVQ